MRLTALDARHRLRRRHLELRAMDRLIDTPRFDEAMTRATDSQVLKLELILKSDSADQLKQWIKEAMNLPLDQKPLRALHILARDLMIPKYSRMTRAHLIKALERRTNKDATSVG